jgi:hypothetical protein
VAKAKSSNSGSGGKLIDIWYQLLIMHIQAALLICVPVAFYAVCDRYRRARKVWRYARAYGASRKTAVGIILRRFEKVTRPKNLSIARLNFTRERSRSVEHGRGKDNEHQPCMDLEEKQQPHRA